MTYRNQLGPTYKLLPCQAFAQIFDLDFLNIGLQLQFHYFQLHVEFVMLSHFLVHQKFKATLLHRVQLTLVSFGDLDDVSLTLLDKSL